MIAKEGYDQIEDLAQCDVRVGDIIIGYRLVSERSYHVVHNDIHVVTAEEKSNLGYNGAMCLVWGANNVWAGANHLHRVLRPVPAAVRVPCKCGKLLHPSLSAAKGYVHRC